MQNKQEYVLTLYNRTMLYDFTNMTITDSDCDILGNLGIPLSNKIGWNASICYQKSTPWLSRYEDRKCLLRVTPKKGGHMIAWSVGWSKQDDTHVVYLLDPLGNAYSTILWNLLLIQYRCWKGGLMPGLCLTPSLWAETTLLSRVENPPLSFYGNGEKASAYLTR